MSEQGWIFAASVATALACCACSGELLGGEPGEPSMTGIPGVPSSVPATGPDAPDVPGPVAGELDEAGEVRGTGVGLLGCPSVLLARAPVRETAVSRSELSQPFAAVCATCHGPGGEGLRGYPAIPSDLSLDEYKRAVRVGKDAMPPFASSFISDLQLEQDYAALRGGLEPQATESPVVWGEARIQQAYAEGLQAFRKPDLQGQACASCHSPDGIDLAAIAYTDATILRRGLKHLEPDDANRVVDFIHAQRLRFGIDEPCSTQWRPFQPGGDVLPGDTTEQQDDAFGAELVRRGVLVATGRVETLAQARTAFDQLQELDLRTLRIGVALPRWTEDGFNGDEHHSLNDWIPSTPRVSVSGSLESLFDLDDQYLAEPSEENLRRLDEAIRQHDNMVGPADPFFEHVMSIKWRSVLLASHFFRMALQKQPGWLEKPKVPFPHFERLYNPFFKQGVRSKEGVLCAGGCEAAVQGLPEDARKELSVASSAEAQINSLSEEIAHPWFTLGQLLDQGLLQTENGSDGTTLNPFYWNLNRFPHDQVHKPFFNAHHVVQQVHYLVALGLAGEFPRRLSDGLKPPSVHPLLSGHWLRVEGIADPLRGFEARTATSVRLRVNLLRMFVLLQRDLLTNGGVVADEQALLARLGEWQTLPEALVSASDRYPELASDRQLFTADTLALIAEVASLITSANTE